ncbi:unnamed protein product, partial [Rotaria sordida]
MLNLKMNQELFMDEQLLLKGVGVIEEFDQEKGYGHIKPNDKPNQVIVSDCS